MTWLARWAIVPLIMLGVQAYASVHPVVLDSTAWPLEQRAPDGTAHTLTLTAFGRDMLLELQLVELSTHSAITEHHAGDAVQILKGHVIGDPNSWVRLLRDQDNWSGHVFTDNTLLRLESRERLSSLLETLPALRTYQHLMDDRTHEWFLVDVRALAAQSASLETRRLAQLPGHAHTTQAGGTLVDYLAFPPAPADTPNDTDSGADVSLLSRMDIPTVATRALRVGIVVDSRFNEFHNGRGLSRALSIMNGVDGILQDTLGLAVQVDSIVVYDEPESDPMRDRGGSVESILRHFSDVRLDDARLPRDLSLVHLFTGHTDPDRVIGLGWIDTVCRVDGYDVSVSSPFPYDTLLATHEIAHNLGALHDDEAACLSDTTEPDPSHIMWRRLSSNTQAQFSACSIRHMRPSLGRRCNLDNIDVSLTLRATRASDPTQRIVALEVLNRDSTRIARDLISITEFPDGTGFANLPSACRTQGMVMTCNHGSIRAADSTTESVLITLPAQADQRVSARLQLTGFADSQELDNRATLDLSLASSTADDGGTAGLQISEAGVGADDPPGTAAARGDTRVGSLGGVWLLLLLGVNAWRRHRPQVMRSTE